MEIWKCENWKELDSRYFTRSGLFLHFESGVNQEVKRACVAFARWLRKEYYFPLSVHVYVKETKQILNRKGELVLSTCWLPDHKEYHPYIRIATGDYEELLFRWGKDNAIASILMDLSCELTHYFQWVNNIQQSIKKERAQARECAKTIIKRYATTRDHP